MNHPRNILIVIIIGLPVLYPLIGDGFILTHDQFFPLHRLVALERCISEGQIPPRWSGIFALGYGYPFFNYYGPLAYYLGYIINLIISNYVLSTHIVIGFSLIFGGIGTYFWLKNLLNDYAAILGAVVYIYLPYHLVNAYVRGDLSELLASSFFPWVLWSFSNLMTNKYHLIKWILSGAFFYSMVLLSHNIMSLLFTIYLILFIIFFTGMRNDIKSANIQLLSLILGMGLTAYFWIPAFFEKDYVQIGSLLSSARYQDHFVYPWQLLSLNWGYGGSVKGPDDGMSFQIGLIPFVLSLISGYLFFIKKKNNIQINYYYFSWISLIIFIFLMSPISQLFWDIIPLIKYTLFPWRFLSLLAIPISFLSGFIIFIASQKYRHNLNLLLSSILIGLIMLMTIPYLQKRQISIDNIIFKKSTIWEIEKNTHCYGTTMSNEYLPIWVKKMPESQSYILIKPEKNMTVNYTPLSYSSIWQKYRLNINKNGTIVFSIFYFPGWKMYDNGKEIPLNYNNGGLIQVDLESGQHFIELRFENTKVRLISNFLTLLSWILFYILLVISITRDYKKRF